MIPIGAYILRTLRAMLENIRSESLNVYERSVVAMNSVRVETLKTSVAKSNLLCRQDILYKINIEKIQSQSRIY